MEKLEIYIHCDDNESLKSWTKKRYLLEADKRLGLGVFKDFSEASGTPEFVLNIQPSDSALPKGGKWTGLWHIDVQLDSRQFPAWYPHFDTVFLASTAQISPFENGHLLFQAADPVVHKRVGVEQKYDVVFSGTIGSDSGRWHEDRVRLYRLLQSQFNLNDVGKGHPPADYVKHVSAGKVIWVQGGISREGKGMCAQRFFESLAIGPMLCAWNQDIPLTGLVEGEDFLCYRTDEEFVEKLQLLLGDIELRNRIAANGRKKALMYHTYEQRAMAIYNTVRDFVA